MGKSSNTSVTSNDPWTKAQPYIEGALTKGNAAYAATPKTPFGGQYFARPNQMQQKAVAMVNAAAPQLGAGADAVQGYASDLVSGKYLSPDSNPYVKGMAEAATRGATDNLRRNVLPGIDSAAISQGAYGGSKNGIASALAASETDKNVRDTYANMYGQNYATERGYQDNAGQKFAQANDLRLAPAKALDAAGSTVNNWDQQLVQEAFQKYQDSQNAPWLGLDKLFNMATGTGGGQTTTTTPQVPWWQQGLQAGLGGLAAWNTFKE